MKDEFLKLEKQTEIGCWTCPECGEDCDVESYSEVEIWEDADSGMEYEIVKVSTDKCIACGHTIEHNLF